MTDKIVFNGYTQDELDRQYNQRSLVPDISAYLAQWAEGSEKARETLPCRLDVSYGPNLIEKLDFFGPTDGRRPCLVFFHGGAWRLLAKQDSATAALTFVPAGSLFAAVDFANADTGKLDGMVDQCRRAVAFLAQHADEFGLDPQRIFVCGHSSGAHLAAMVAATDWVGTVGASENAVCGLVAISGLYDLQPVRLSSRNDYLRLDEAGAARNSPIASVANFPPRTIVAYGEFELDEFKRQSRDLVTALSSADKDVEEIVGDGLNHFDMDRELYQTGTPLCQAIFDLVGL